MALRVQGAQLRQVAKKMKAMDTFFSVQQCALVSNSFLVTTSKAPVTSSDALVSNSFKVDAKWMLVLKKRKPAGLVYFDV